MKVHYIKREDMLIAFFPNTKRFFCINQMAKDLIDAMVSGQSKQVVMKNFKLNEKEYQKYYDNIYQEVYLSQKEPHSQESIPQRILNRLVIHLTNDCNMRCRYCYANGGNYHSKRDMMSSETLDQLFDVFFKHFDIISNIQFFGGEPLMNMPLLEHACQRFCEKAKERNYPITFGIVTNATLIDKKFIELVNKYKLRVTVSYDGHPIVNNIMRVMSDGSASSSLILKKAKWLKKETGQPETVEVTYNRYHIKNGISILDCVKHIQTELPDTQVHLVPAGGADTSDYSISELNIFADSIHEIMNQEIQEHVTPTYSLAQRIFYALENRETNIPFICDAGLGTLSVSVKGDIYPCFMFTDDLSMCYGNIGDFSLFETAHAKSLQGKLNAFCAKDQNEECKDCFIKRLCNGCLGLNSFHSGDPFKLAPTICCMFRTMTEEAIVEYAKRYRAEEGERVKHNV